jgi:hypothetical protein
MASKRDWRRMSVATIFAGAFVSLVAGASPASAGTSAVTASDCKLGSLVCSILGGGNGKSVTPPKSSGGGTSTKPKPDPKQAAPAQPQDGGSGSGSSGSQAPQPFALSASGLGPAAPRASSQQAPPVLPDVMPQNPQVLPETAPFGQLTRARPVAATEAAGSTMPPLLVATASGLVGAVAALNVSVVNGRLRRPRHD